MADQPVRSGTTTAAQQTKLTDPEWQAAENDPEFRALVQSKRSFILPATVFFIVFYFAFLVVVGYLPDFVNTNVFGNINVAYLLALSQFVVGWLLMVLYVRRAGGFDIVASRIAARIKGGKK